MSRRPRSRRRSGDDPSGYQAGPGTVATLRYELYDAEGELVERCPSDAPLVVLLGYGDVAPAVERAVEGLSGGAEREVTLAPEDAFGERDPEAVIEVDRAEFPPDLEAGDELVADREDGRPVALKVLEISDDVVVLDTNHPLSGQRVKLRLFVDDVRPASPEELSRATDRVTQAEPSAGGALLPVERLLRRGGGPRPPEGDEPPPPPSGRVA